MLVQGYRSLWPGAGSGNRWGRKKDHSGPQQSALGHRHSGNNPWIIWNSIVPQVHQGELELGSSAPVTYGDSKGSQWVILQYPERKRDWLFPVLSSTSSKSRQINLVAAMFKTNRRNWLTTRQIELRNSLPKGLWLQEVWWGSNGGL